MSSLTTSIPTGSWILVTGASGFLASHVCLEFLQRGFRVRGAVRDTTQSSWLLESARFKPYADLGAIELVSVPHLGADGAYDEAIKGAAAVIHIAYVTNIVPDPNEVITPMVTGVRSILTAASREPSVREVVFTSSALAASPLASGVDNGVVGRDSWNDAVLEAAWAAPPPYGMAHALANYPASKVAAEKEVWRFVESNKGLLHFNVNVVSPAGITGEPLHKKHIEGPANWVVHAYRGNKAVMDTLPASKQFISPPPASPHSGCCNQPGRDLTLIIIIAFYADVKDVALLHVAAALDPEVKNARLQAWGHSANWNEILAILRKLRPQKKFVDDYPDPHHLRVSIDQTESVALLNKWCHRPGKGGWTSLEDSIFENIMNPYLEVE
jgi:nucleoside-diphosphate-sugar epimerase